MGLSDSILSRSQMKSIRGGYSGAGDCPMAGTTFFYTDDSVCGYFTAGANAPGSSDCTGTVVVTAYQPCGFA